MLQIFCFCTSFVLMLFFCGGDWVETLNYLSGMFTVYMVIKVFWVNSLIPEIRQFQLPKFTSIPEKINCDHLPEFEEKAGSYELGVFVRFLIQKIALTMDELVVQRFYDMQMETLKEGIDSEYDNVESEISILSYEGVIGTLLGLVTFMAQATQLFKLPDTSSHDRLTEVLIHNLSSVNLLVVSLAFVTSIIGWSVKGYIGRTIQQRRKQSFDSLRTVEKWLQQNILARVAMSAQKVILLSEDIQSLGTLLEHVQFKAQFTNGGVIWTCVHSDENISSRNGCNGNKVEMVAVQETGETVDVSEVLS
ncbi:hypothetical protein HYV70_03965 [Candidatus Uhrbacteria bacterium]|nr:hypothetical protein [Candidatus Uhrbacteria bacterium]